MSSYSERTFGQKYTKASAILEHLKAISGYQPTNPTIAITAFETFLGEVQDANDLVASEYGLLQSARADRLKLYYDDDGLLARARLIRDYLPSASLEGKKFSSYVEIRRIVQRMANNRPSKRVPQTVVPDDEKDKTISTSERSFGSLVRAGRDILKIITNVANYAPVNTNLIINNFELLLEKIDTQNDEVASLYSNHKEAIAKRFKIYKELDFRVMQIKLALATQYGKKSFEYREVINIGY